MKNTNFLTTTALGKRTRACTCFTLPKSSTLVYANQKTDIRVADLTKMHPRYIKPYNLFVAQSCAIGSRYNGRGPQSAFWNSTYFLPSSTIRVCLWFHSSSSFCRVSYCSFATCNYGSHVGIRVLKVPGVVFRGLHWNSNHDLW